MPPAMGAFCMPAGLSSHHGMSSNLYLHGYVGGVHNRYAGGTWRPSRHSLLRACRRVHAHRGDRLDRTVHLQGNRLQGHRGLLNISCHLVTSMRLACFHARDSLQQQADQTGRAQAQTAAMQIAGLIQVAAARCANGGRRGAARNQSPGWETMNANQQFAESFRRPLRQSLASHPQGKP